MQHVTIYQIADSENNATNFKNALATYAASYFDSYETDFTGSEKLVKCMVGQTAAVTFGVEVGYNKRMHVYYGTGSDYLTLDNCNVIEDMYVLDNAILIFGHDVDASQESRYNKVLLLCKRNDGKTAVTALISRSNIVSANTANKYCTITVNPTMGAIVYDELPIIFTSNSDLAVVGYTPFSKYDGITLKDVYVVTDSDFRSHTEPFTYSLNGQTYTGIGGNYFAVKGN